MVRVPGSPPATVPFWWRGPSQGLLSSAWPSLLTWWRWGCRPAEVTTAGTLQDVSLLIPGRQSPFQCLQGIYSEAGLRGCYKGLLPQALRDIKANAIYFITYQVCLDWMKGMEERENTAREIFLAGGVAGLLSWQTIIYLDVIKSRIQTDSLTQPRYRGTLDCIQQSYRRDGLRVFTRGQLL